VATSLPFAASALSYSATASWNAPRRDRIRAIPAWLAGAVRLDLGAGPVRLERSVEVALALVVGAEAFLGKEL
jgi:hypothetical protein